MSGWGPGGPVTFIPNGVEAEDLWHDLDRRRKAIQSPGADSTGVCSVTFDQVRDDQQWLIERVSVQNTTSNTKTCQAALYLDTAQPLNLLDGTRSGALDFADEASALLIPSGRSLLVQWTSCNAGDIGTATIQYRVRQSRIS